MSTVFRSDRAQFVTGATFTIDEGQSL